MARGPKNPASPHRRPLLQQLRLRPAKTTGAVTRPPAKAARSENRPPACGRSVGDICLFPEIARFAH